MDGSAVVTTRLSSDPMNKAAEVTTKVHTVRRLSFIPYLQKVISH